MYIIPSVKLLNFLGVNMKIYCDSGYSFSESTADGAARFAKNVYERFGKKSNNLIFKNNCLLAKPGK